MRKKAFTLAEVLITIGIIGVVAALTIPALIGKYQKLVWVAQLQKSMNTVQNGLKNIMADEEVDNLKDTEFYKHYSNYRVATSVDFDKTKKLISKYFKVVKIKARTDRDYYDYSHVRYHILSSDYYTLDLGVFSNPCVFWLNDGGKIYLTFTFLSSGNASYAIGQVYIDVNGDKGPNKWGRDFFAFDIDNKGMLHPSEGKNDCYDWGTACAQKIIDEGWKMNY